MKLVFSTIAVMFMATTGFAGQHICASSALENSVKLFALHYGTDLEHAKSVVSTNIVQKPSVKASNGKSLVVLETNAAVGKMGDFRIRMIYGLTGSSAQDCVLMGQEILETGSVL